MRDIVLGTGEGHVPTLQLAQPRGRYAWQWRHGAEGPEIISRPVRLVRGQPDPTGATVEPPGWMLAIADVWWRTLERLHNERSMNPASLHSRARDIEMAYSAIAKAITQEPPGLRQHAAKWAAELHRRSLEHGTPLEESEMYLTASARLTDLLRRTSPRHAAKEDGPTAQTVAKQVPDALEEMLNGHLLNDRQKEAAVEARAIFRALTHRLDAKVGNMEAAGAAGAGFSPPFEAIKPPLDEAYDKRYRPWSKAMAKRAWWYDPARRGMFKTSECRYAASITYWPVLGAVLFEGLALAATDARYRLPPGRAQIIVKVGLDEYGRVV